MSTGRDDCRRLSEADLAARAMAGAAPAWDEIVRRHTHRVVVSLLARGVPLDAAEDLAQEVWMRLVQQQREGRLRSLQLPGLAIAQAGWLAREAERTRARRERLAGTWGPLDDRHDVEDVDPAVDPERYVTGREQLDLVNREIERCSPRARQIYRAVYGPEPRSHEQVARDLGLSVQRVRQILHETRTRVRRALRWIEGESQP